MLEFIKNQTHAQMDFAVIWLHGLGADGHDFESIADELELPATVGIRFVFPHAPIQPVGINGGMKMRAWYDIKDMDLAQQVDRQGIEKSAALIQEIIRDLESQGLPSQRCFVAGFSQGGAVALHLAQSEHLAGILALSSYGPTLVSAPSLKTTHVWMGHGEYDPIVPLSLALKTCQDLNRLQCPVELKRYPMPHSVCAKELQDISQWLSSRMEVF